MQIVTTQSPTVILEVQAIGLDGGPKSNVASASVRVFYMYNGAETEVLATTQLVQVGTSNVWRYTWLPGSLTTRTYVIEYTLTDSDGVVGGGVEDMVVEPPPLTSLPDLTTLRKIETNKWELDQVNSRMIMYDDDQTTPLLIFNLFDSNGQPSVTEVFKRVPT